MNEEKVNEEKEEQDSDEKVEPNFNSNFKPVYFHEIDHAESEISTLNDLTLREI